MRFLPSCSAMSSCCSAVRSRGVFDAERALSRIALSIWIYIWSFSLKRKLNYRAHEVDCFLSHIEFMHLLAEIFSEFSVGREHTRSFLGEVGQDLNRLLLKVWENELVSSTVNLKTIFHFDRPNAYLISAVESDLFIGHKEGSFHSQSQFLFLTDQEAKLPRETDWKRVIIISNQNTLGKFRYYLCIRVIECSYKSNVSPVQ